MYHGHFKKITYLIYFLNFYLFIYFWLRWVFVAVCGLSLVAVSGGYSSLWCAGFSLRWLLLLWSAGSRREGFSSCGSWALEHRLSSCGTQAQVLHGMWDLPGPGLKPVSPALAGGFLTHCATREVPKFYLFIFCTSGSYQLSILYILMYICQSQSPNSSHHHTPLFKIFISLVVLGLSCGRWVPQLWLTSSLVAARGLLSCGMRTLSCGMHVGSSSPDQTWAPCIGSAESYPLNHQEVPHGRS